MTRPAFWRVGELAEQTGLTVRTLHYYDEIGLLSPSHRSDVGYRLYTAIHDRLSGDLSSDQFREKLRSSIRIQVAHHESARLVRRQLRDHGLVPANALVSRAGRLPG